MQSKTDNSSSLDNQEKEWRYERKIRVERIGVRSLESLILLNTAFFKPLHQERRINNIYFDDSDYSCFFANVNGETAREKFRIRWYDDTFGYVNKPVLEMKIKRAALGTKKRYPLEGFDISRNLKNGTINRCLSGLDAPISIRSTLKGMRPTLLNSYVRRYFISADKKYRLTLDYGLTYYKLEADSSTILSKRSPEGLVIEIKYDSENDDGIDAVLNDFQFRLSKNSKYVIGFEMTQY